jgi:dTMP kinase
MSSGDPRGLFITFEGVEGSGKSTQLETIAGRLRSAGVDLVVTREPGGTEVGRRLRSILLEPGGETVTPFVELLLYAADRAQHIETVILPALERGHVAISDRYLDATLAYQGFGRRLGTEIVLEVHSRPPLDLRPARTILLDLDPEIALARARRRNDDRGVSGTEGRFEDEDLAFHRRVRDGYLELARREPDRYRVVPATGEPPEVESRILEALADLLPLGEVGGQR